ncbi:MAG TPA: glucoamylase family protein, partial [Rhodanobacteraceae bacterium]|nr:glucoamylase family protein [Rhodanobacteraceae bacterium]
PSIFAGLRDTLSVAIDTDPDSDRERWTPLLRALDEQEASLPKSAGELFATLTALNERLRGLEARSSEGIVFDATLELRRRILATLADVELFFGPAGGDAEKALDLASTLHELASARAREDRAASQASITCRAIEALAARCAEFARADFDFLHDESRSLFTIGYNVTERRSDAGFYDLLASEARLGVFVAIAQGKVAQDTWFSLGRLLTYTAGRQVLLSWSGSMFEYLMPQLVMPSFPGTLLEETFRSAVATQIAYARSKGVPWGISESGYNMTDAAQNYQYRAFGVPGLGLQRGLAQELVIAPYASALALTVLPRDAGHNLRRLADSGWLTPLGFYEAIDYTSERVPPGETAAVVRSFMAHHHGMTLLAIAHAVLDRPMQKRFAADPELKATMLLLQERTPRSAINWSNDPAMVDVRSAHDVPQTAVRVFSQADTRRPALQLLTNGRYHVMVTNSGGGYSRWRDLAITRWREDATRDPWGVFCYLRDVDTGKVWSNTPAPTRAAVDASEAIFTESSVEFRRRLDDIEAHTQIVVSPEDDIELRRIRITNRGRVARTIEVTSYAEVVLSSGIADSLHPAFGNLFVQTEILPDRDSILATRRARSSEDPQRWMMHLLALHGGESQGTSFETDRLRFIGRNRSVEDAAALRAANDLSGTEGSVLDP